MRRQPRGQHGHSRKDQNDRLEQGAADIQGNLRQHGIGLLKAGDIREEQLQEVGDADEDHPADQDG